MTIPIRTQRIAQAVYSTICRQTKIHTTKKFELDALVHMRWFAFNLHLVNDRVYHLIDTHIITNEERRAVVPIVTDRLQANGYVYTYMENWPSLAGDSIPIEPLEENVTCDAVRDIVDHASFFRTLYLTPSQMAHVRAQMPDGVPANNMLFLHGFDDDLLRQCNLSPVQIGAWKYLLRRLVGM